MNTAVYNALEGARLVAYLASPALPFASRELAHQLGLSDFAAPGSWDTESKFGAFAARHADRDSCAPLSPH